MQQCDQGRMVRYLGALLWSPFARNCKNADHCDRQPDHHQHGRPMKLHSFRVPAGRRFASDLNSRGANLFLGFRNALVQQHNTFRSGRDLNRQQRAEFFDRDQTMMEKTCKQEPLFFGFTTEASVSSNPTMVAQTYLFISAQSRVPV
jgi:hypothetical protein